MDKKGLEHSTYDWLIEGTPLADVLQRCHGGFDLIPSNTDLTAAEVALMQADGREQRLKRRLEEAAGYDFILIDCPPSLNILTLNALLAAHSVLIPMQCEYYALEGLSALLETVDWPAALARPELPERLASLVSPGAPGRLVALARPGQAERPELPLLEKVEPVMLMAVADEPTAKP